MILVVAVAATYVLPLLLACGVIARPASSLRLPRRLFLLLAIAAVAVLAPASFKALNGLAAIIVALGIALPAAAHLGLARWPLAREGAVALGIGGLLVHSFLDGVALFSFAGLEESRVVAPMILLDRLTMGLSGWVLALAAFGRVAAVVSTVALGLATIGGYCLVQRTPALSSTTELGGALNALLLGFMLYFAVRHGIGPSHDSSLIP